jgi:hypothetical protein
MRSGIGRSIGKKRREVIYKRDGGICQVCKMQVKFELFEAGHIIDHANGGTRDIDNLLTMCQRCNKRKPSHTTKDEFLAWIESGAWQSRTVADVSKDVTDRFWLKVDKTEGCWAWRGATSKAGYATFYQHGNSSSSIPAHRYSYWLHCGEIPIGYHVRHKCHNRACVRPDHLQIGTPKDNANDKVRSGRSHRVSEETNGNSKLTREEATAILEAKKYNISARRLAERYNVSLCTIYRIWSGRAWSKSPIIPNEVYQRPSTIDDETNIEYRIMLKVRKQDNGCWNWIGCIKKKDGRPIFATNKFGEQSVRRWLWEIKNGKIPKDKAVINVCENNICVNPDHHIVDSPIKAMHWMREGYSSGKFTKPTGDMR